MARSARTGRTGIGGTETIRQSRGARHVTPRTAMRHGGTQMPRQSSRRRQSSCRLARHVLLVAPALEFHSTSETLIGSLAPGIEIVRIGLAADWRSQLRVMFRLRGAERP